MISCPSLLKSRYCWILTAATLVYFVAFPEDCESLLLPLRSALSLSYAVSPWLYGLTAVALACWTARLVWGRSERT
jgi:hypothetical protein